MSEHLTEKQFENYQKRFLSSSELASIDEHIQICANCRKELALRFNTKRGIEAMRSDFRSDAAIDDHLTYEQLEGYLDKKLDEVEQEIISSHLEVCATCTDEEKDLRTFRSALLEGSPAALLKSGFFAFLNIPRYRNFAKIATIAAIFVIAFLPFLFQLNSLQKKVNSLEKENQKLNSDLKEANSKLRNQQPLPIENNISENQIAMSLKDAGMQIQMHNDGHVIATKLLSPEEETLVKTALTKKTLETPPILADLISKKDVLMGSSNNSPFSLIAPVGTVVQTDRPQFRWTKLQGAAGSIVRIFDHQFHLIAVSPNLNQSEWNIQESLKPGNYLWQVTASKDGKEIVVPAPPLPEAKFRIMSSEERAKLEEAEKNYEGSHLMLGILYAQAGVLDDAEKEFEALLKLNPNSTQASELLQNIRKVRKG